MICPKCERPYLEGATFCDGCGAPLQVVPESPVTAVIGPTIRLNEPAPVTEIPPPAIAPIAPATRPTRLLRARQLNGGMWLIGIGILFLTGTFWPWILVLCGVSGYLEETGRGRHQEAARTLIFMVGLAILFSTPWFWPGILILIGITALLSPEVRPRHA